jgi:hypothetical protein
MMQEFAHFEVIDCQAIIFASRAPLSIIFVGIGDDEQELAELERLGTAGNFSNKAYAH